MGDRTPIELILHPANERLHRVRIRTTHSGGRHHPGPKLADHLFADFCVIAETSEIQLVQEQVGRLRLRVVAHYTVLVHERTFARPV
jgi:hypothetical protein